MPARPDDISALTEWHRRELLVHRGRRPLPSGIGPAFDDPDGPFVPGFEVPWLQPLPDTALRRAGEDPGQAVVERAGVRLALVAAVQLLPPRQRAVVILREALGYSAAEVASMLDTSVAAVNSASQRGRATWELFAQRWPSRTSEFANAMNRMPKLVVSRTITDVRAWSGSTLLEGELFEALERERADRDLVVVGSTSIVHALAERCVIDEYRLLVLPFTLGRGTRCFASGATPQDLRLTSVDATNGAVLLCYERLASGTVRVR
jgi:dihydrofolate reductase